MKKSEIFNKEIHIIHNQTYPPLPPPKKKYLVAQENVLKNGSIQKHGHRFIMNANWLLLNQSGTNRQKNIIFGTLKIHLKVDLLNFGNRYIFDRGIQKNDKVYKISKVSK